MAALETKIIFLDVDGVLNCVNSKKNDPNDIHILDPSILNRLQKVIKQTNAKVVISSSWRDVPHALEKLRKALAKYGIEYIGCTKSLDFKSSRTHEIKYWLAINQNRLNVTNWIAIDDLPLDLDKNHFIQTKIEYGLTNHHINQCVNLLNAKTK